MTDPSVPPTRPVSSEPGGGVRPEATPGAPGAARSAPRPTTPPNLGTLSGSETLLIAGAVVFLIIGEILLGEILGGAGNATVFGLGGITLQGVLAGEVLLFTWLARPRPGRATIISAGAAQTVVTALVLAIVLFELGEFLGVLKNLSGYFGLGFAGILLVLARLIGAALMGLGVLSAWMPASPTPASSAGTRPPG
jgi:hypothetical protein